jgi:3-deoxy-D-manno-octulosonic-acid transferase
MYTLLIHLYALMVELLAPFHKKARMMRFGQWKTNRILRQKIDRSARYIWFHASSLGEFEQGRPMMEQIKACHPQYKILLTFFSPSGYEVRKHYAAADVVCYLPFDTLYKVKKFLRLANPCMAIFIKYEFWGNYLTELKKRHVSTYIISAIFRPGQPFFKWYGRPYLKALRSFSHLFVQDKASLQLLARYGLNNVTVEGDTRFDRVLDIRRQAKPIPLVEQFVKNKNAGKQFTLVAGSSWPQDEDLIIPYFNEHPEIKLIIAPHEIDKAHLQNIQAKLKRPSARLSDAAATDLSGQDCLIIDSFGLLSSIYRYADVAYVGGGFGKGIHNILEAAVYGVPVLFGPKYRKFKEAADMIAAGGGFSVPNEAAFRQKTDQLLTRPPLLQAAGQAAGAFVQNNAGATANILAQLPL